MSQGLKSYALGQIVHQSARTQIQRATRETDGTTVFLKSSSSSVPSAHDVEVMRREFRFLTHVQGEGTPRAVELIEDGSRVILALEDGGHAPLKALKTAEGLSLDQFFALACGITRVLARVHAQRVVHRDINPNNIVTREADDDVLLIDFGLAASFEELAGQEEASLQGTLAYLSPEQTGRMSRKVDARSDLYALGITFYELLAGERPFAAEDMLGWIHAHLSQPIPSLREKNPAVPATIEALITRMVEKEPERRYQSADSLLHDLHHCRHAWEGGESFDDFELGSLDERSRLDLERVQVERKDEERALRQAMYNGLTRVEGGDGCGKSALVERVLEGLSPEKARWIKVSCVKGKAHEPLQAVATLLTQIANEMLGASHEALETLRHELHQSLGAEARLLSDLAPSFAPILGDLAQLPELDHAAINARRARVLAGLLRLLTRTRRLLLVLEDAHWLDALSEEALTTVLLSPELPLFSIVATTSQKGAALTSAWHRIAQEQPERLGEVMIDSLSVRHVEALLMQILSLPQEEVSWLAGQLFVKTSGNPLILKTLIGELCHQGVLFFDFEATRWCWDEAQIERVPVQEQAMSLVLERLNHLDASSRAVLRVASCLGDEFLLKELDELCARLGVAQREGVREALDVGHRQGVTQPLDADRHGFLHARLTEALHDEYAPEERARVHHRITKTMLKWLTREEQDQRGFELLSHLRACQPLLITTEERHVLVHFERLAAERARIMGVHDVAAHHFQAAIAVFDVAQWAAYGDERYALYFAMIEAMTAAGQTDLALATCESMLYEPQPPLRIATLCQYKAALLSHMGAYDAVLDVVIEGLGVLDMRFEVSDETLQLRFEESLQRLYANLEMWPVEIMSELPEVGEPKDYLLMALLVRGLPAARQRSPLLFKLMALTMCDLTLTRGATPEAGLALTIAAGILFEGDRDKSRAMALATVGDKLLARFTPHSAESVNAYLQGVYLHHINRGADVVIESLDRAARLGRALGEMEHAAEALMMRAALAFAYGEPLHQVSQHVQQAASFSEQVNMMGPFFGSQPYVQTLEVLTRREGECEEWLFGATGEGGWQALDLAAFMEGYQMAARCFWAGRREKGWAHIERLIAHHELIEGTSLEFDFHLYVVVLAADRLWHVYEGEHEMVRGLAEQSVARLARLAKRNAKLYGPAHRLAEAALGQWRGASFFDVVEEYATFLTEAEDRLLPWRAYASECQGLLWLERGRNLLAKACIQEAYALYDIWGCGVKLLELETFHPSWCGQYISSSTFTTRQSITFTNTNTQTSRSRTFTSDISQMLDLDSVLKATQAITSELKSDGLFAALMRTIVENAGAQRAVLLMAEEGMLYVHARLQGDEPLDLAHRPLHQVEDLAHEVLHFCARAKQEVLIEDGQRHERFKKDRHIKQAKVRSLICVPILQGGDLLGVIYLENNMAPHAFTPRHGQLLQLIAGQAATSIQKVRAFEQLEQRVERRTRQLAQRNREMQALFDLLPQGVLTIDADLRIEPGASTKAAELLGRERLDGVSFIDALFSGAELDAEQVSATEMALRFSYGGPAFMCELNWEHLIRSFSRVGRDGRRSYYELDWVPISDDVDDVLRVLLTVRDVTLLKELDLAAKENEREFEILQQVFRAGLSDFTLYHENAVARLEENRALLAECGEAVAPQTLNVVFRNLHTIKGNARVLGLSMISGVTHHAEEPIEALRREPGNLEEREALAARSEALRDLLEEHEHLLREVVGDVSSGGEEEGLSREGVAQVRERLQAAHAQPTITHQVIEEVLALLDRSEGVPLEGVVKDVARMFPSLAEELHKPVPSVALCGEAQPILRPQLARTLNDVLVHVFRNAFDHGIEPPEERAVAGKEEAGKIELHVINEQGRYQVRILDDGRGLALSKLRKKLSANASDEEVAETIFASGTSTAEQVSDVSGRGVGMDAVRSFLKEQGGDVCVEFTAPELRGYRPFALRLDLPPGLLIA